jgi:hypothetical protein
VTLAPALLEHRGADHDGLHREIGPAQDLPDPVEDPSRQLAHHEEIDVAALVLVAAGERAEDVDGLDGKLAAQALRELD